MYNEILKQHYNANHNRLVKRYSFSSGTVWNAEDIVQEAYANALQYLHSFNGDNFNNWFTSILNNALRDFKKKEQGRNTLEFDEDDYEAVLECITVKQSNIDIRSIIKNKTEPAKEVLTLWFEEEITARDVSLICGVNYSTCRSIIRRFREELQKRYS